MLSPGKTIDPGETRENGGLPPQSAFNPLKCSDGLRVHLLLRVRESQALVPSSTCELLNCTVGLTRKYVHVRHQVSTDRADWIQFLRVLNLRPCLVKPPQN